MAGGRSNGKAGSKRGPRKKSTTSSTRKSQRRPSEYAKEAVAEWGKAARLTGAALSPLVRRTAARITSASDDKGGRIGDAADAVLSKMGKPGKLASKLGVGSRMVERARPSRNGGSANGDGSVTEEHEDEPVAEQEQEEPLAEEEQEEPVAEKDGEPVAEEDEDEADDAEDGESPEAYEEEDEEDEPVEAYEEEDEEDEEDEDRRPHEAYPDVEPLPAR